MNKQVTNNQEVQQGAGTGYAYNDGGRRQAGYKGEAGDCVVRAIAVALQLPYAQVRKDLMAETEKWLTTGRDSKAKRATRKRLKGGYSVRNGVRPEVYESYIKAQGWKPVPGVSAANVYLDTVPSKFAANCICKTRKHLVAVTDNVVQDTWDSRYWSGLDWDTGEETTGSYKVYRIYVKAS